MKRLKVIAVMLLIGALYILYTFYLRQGNVNKIYQHTEYSDIWKRNCKSTVVLVDDAPLSRYAQKKLWQKNSKEIIEKWKPFTDKCDEILFVNNNVGRIKRSGDVKYWIADDAICLNGVIGGCISWEDRLFYVGIGRPFWSDDISDEVNGTPVHLSFVD